MNPGGLIFLCFFGLQALGTELSLFSSKSEKPSQKNRATTAGPSSLSSKVEKLLSQRVPTEEAFDSSLSSKVKRLLSQRGLKSSRLGLIVSRLSPSLEAKELYTLNGDRLFVPASLVKIPVLSALYHYYPPHKKFQTEIVSSGAVREGVLNGDLVVKGGGDPAFVSESLWNLINVFLRSGIREVRGNILVDETLYRPDPLVIRTDRSHSAPISSASFNWNTVTFYIRPGEKADSPARIFVDPENSYIRIKNHVVTSKRDRTQVKVERVSVSQKGEVFRFKGVISLKAGEISKFRNIRNPPLWLGHNIRSFLKRRGISVTGEVRKGSCPSSCRTLALWESDPFSILTSSLMKYSNNFMIRMLTAHLPLEGGGQRVDFKEGARYSSQSHSGHGKQGGQWEDFRKGAQQDSQSHSGRWKKGGQRGDLREGVQWIREYLSGPAGLTSYSLKEPSGLSRGNKFAPRDLQKILLKDLKSPHSPEIFFSYPLPGGPGTLEKRYQDRPKDYHIRAKTGFLSGVAGLAGFSTTRSGERYVFVFLYNGPAGKTLSAQRMFDDLVLSLGDH